ncbi:MAG: hypothetical protein U9Q16_00385 [Patescibacteria group bacterium]|nr:hypothetical protein [Patescibacteria group bacterium]
MIKQFPTIKKMFLNNSKGVLSGFLVLFLLSNLFIPFSIGFGQKRVAYAQGIGNFVPRYPQRLIYLAEEIEEASTHLTDLNKKLAEFVNECDCKYGTSQVQKGNASTFQRGDPEAFGECCPNRVEIEKNKNQIIIKVNQLSYLQKLIKKEIDFGLDAEMKTLRENEALELEINLNKLTELLDIDAVENILTVALDNSDIIDDDMYTVEKKGIANWGEDVVLDIIACLTGEQKPIEMKFNVGVGIEDLDLGELRIEKFGLNLPEEIKLSDIADFDDYVIPAPEINIDFPVVDKLEDLHIDSIALHPSSVGMPGITPLDFSCTQVKSQAKQNIEEGDGADHYIDVNWYLKTFSWLSEKCQTMPELKNKMPTSLISGTPPADLETVPNPFCFDQWNVHKSIVSACDQEWQEYYDCIEIGMGTCDKPVAFCFDLGMSNTLERHKAYQRECLNLELGGSCVLNIECDIDDNNCYSTNHDTVLNTLKSKCTQLRKSRTEIESPEPCRFVPIFTQIFEEPDPDYFKDTASVPSHNVSDSSGIKVGANCPVSASPFPKLELPDIIIPDIQLPEFNFSPFLEVHLPNFIFEDLITPDLELCNLDGCKNLIPDIMVDFVFPRLNIPKIEIPEFDFAQDIPGASPSLKIHNLEMPSIQIPMPEFNLTDFISIEFELPEINIPGPKITMEFAGLEINMLNVILGLVQTLFDIPNFCVSAKITLPIPLVFAFPDYYFYWPQFPEIPDLCNNKYININDFCKEIKKALDINAFDEIAKIQQSVNQATQNLQFVLDGIATKIETTITTEITQQLNTMRGEIEKAINKSLGNAAIENGRLRIPSVRAPLEDIVVPMDEVNAELHKIPKEIKIPWAPGLNEIGLDEPIVQKLPSIPFSNLGYQKEIIIKIPGFQMMLSSFNVSIKDYLGFEGKPPLGGNPYPMPTINANVGKITSFHNDISIATKSIVKVLK